MKKNSKFLWKAIKDMLNRSAGKNCGVSNVAKKLILTCLCLAITVAGIFVSDEAFSQAPDFHVVTQSEFEQANPNLIGPFKTNESWYYVDKESIQSRSENNENFWIVTVRRTIDFDKYVYDVNNNNVDPTVRLYLALNVGDKSDFMRFRVNDLEVSLNDGTFSPIVSNEIWMINKKYPQYAVISANITPDSVVKFIKKDLLKKSRYVFDGSFYQWNELDGPAYLSNFVHDVVKKNAPTEIGSTFSDLFGENSRAWLIFGILLIAVVFGYKKYSSSSQQKTKNQQQQSVVAGGSQKFCKKCGNSITAGAKFCSKCGAKTDGD